jgi:glycosyltransferase involved in cell wall biosynthesis
MEQITNYDFIIVPSVWMENYPTTVLEAMAYGVVVIGTDRGGIAEMLDDSRGYVYKFGDNSSINEVFNRVFSISQEEYDRIREKAYCYVKENNSYETYYKRLIKELTI